MAGFADVVRGTSTPAALRRWSVAIAVAALVLAGVGWITGQRADAAAQRLRDSTGPVLVAIQEVRASLAEADAAATAAFLTVPDEDRVQRRAYEDALARANGLLEDVAALAGDDDATIALLREVAADVTRYAGLVEAARATGLAGVEGSEAYLVDAVQLLDTSIASRTQDLITLTTQRLDDDLDRVRSGIVVVALLGLLLLAVLVVIQILVTRRTRRILNPGLVLATAFALAATIWFATATTRAVRAVEDATTQGYASIATTAAVQQAGFTAKAADTIALISSERAATTRARTAGAELEGELFQRLDALADSQRERALTDEVQQRWARYAATAAELRLATGDAALRIATGPAARDFNGFVFAVEGALADNRDQFLAGLDDAATALDRIPLGLLVLGALAAVAGLAGLQARINEYR